MWVTEVQKENIRTFIFSSHLFPFNVSVFYKVNNMKICFYYRCMLSNCFIGKRHDQRNFKADLS